MKWASLFCKQARFVLIVDEYVVVNTQRLLNLLDSMTDGVSRTTVSNTFWCRTQTHYNRSFVAAQKSSSNSPTLWDSRAFVFTGDVAGAFFDMSQRTRPLFDEITTNGMLTHRLGSTLVPTNANYMLLDDDADADNHLLNDSSVFIMGLSAKQALDVRSIWKKIL